MLSQTTINSQTYKGSFAELLENTAEFGNIVLNPLINEDVPLLCKWFEKDYVKKWFNEASDWLEEINNRNGKYKYIKHFIVNYQNKKVGFCQYYDCYFVKELYENITQEKCIYGIDFLIGEEEYLNKGIGKIIIKKLEEKIKEIHGKIITADPDPENIISIKTLLSNGFIKYSAGEYRKEIKNV